MRGVLAKGERRSPRRVLSIVKVSKRPRKTATLVLTESKRVKGRKRHLLVDTLGLIVAVVVTAAHIDDRQAVVALLTGYFADGVKRLRKIWVDGGYVAEWLWTWVWGLKRTHKVDLGGVNK